MRQPFYGTEPLRGPAENSSDKEAAHYLPFMAIVTNVWLSRLFGYYFVEIFIQTCYNEIAEKDGATKMHN
ncbi:MAG: hypothetical protein HFG63_09930 [Lachnospiraceae bacterium]|jgi:hypothetical protein|nr:hypothetical protein [Lachnospiraceae bacterium]